MNELPTLDLIHTCPILSLPNPIPGPRGHNVPSALCLKLITGDFRVCLTPVPACRETANHVTKPAARLIHQQADKRLDIEKFTKYGVEKAKLPS